VIRSGKNGDEDHPVDEGSWHSGLKTPGQSQKKEGGEDGEREVKVLMDHLKEKKSKREVVPSGYLTENHYKRRQSPRGVRDCREHRQKKSGGKLLKEKGTHCCGEANRGKERDILRRTVNRWRHGGIG